MDGVDQETTRAMWAHQCGSRSVSLRCDLRKWIHVHGWITFRSSQNVQMDFWEGRRRKVHVLLMFSDVSVGEDWPFLFFFLKVDDNACKSMSEVSFPWSDAALACMREYFQFLSFLFFKWERESTLPFYYFEWWRKTTCPHGLVWKLPWRHEMC